MLHKYCFTGGYELEASDVRKVWMSCCFGILLMLLSSYAQFPALAQTDSSTVAVIPHAEVWYFDRLDAFGGHSTTILGHPHLIDTPYGKAIDFNGIDDGLFVPVHPLAGAKTFTWEVIFRPDPDGAQAQRFFHLQEQDPSTGQDTKTRMLFELRIVDGQWCLDSFAAAGGQQKALLDYTRLHPLGRWYRIAAVYDGEKFRNYVDGELQGEAELKLVPQLAGRSSIGVRIDKRDYFKRGNSDGKNDSTCPFCRSVSTDADAGKKVESFRDT